MTDENVIQVKIVFKDVTISAKYIIEEKNADRTHTYYNYKVKSVELKAMIGHESTLVTSMLGIIQSLQLSDESESFKDLIYYNLYKALECAMKATFVSETEYQLLINVISESINYSFISPASRCNAFYLIKLTLRKFHKETISDKMIKCIDLNLPFVCLAILSKPGLDIDVYIDANEVLQRVFELIGNKVTKSELIIDSLCKVYLNSKSTYPADLILPTLNAYLNNNKKTHELMTRQAFDIFFGVFSRLCSNLHYNYLQYIEITECMRFFSIMCFVDIAPIYSYRGKIIDFLGSSSILNTDDECEDLNINLKYWSLKLIKNMIEHWNFEIFILLDTEGINKLINTCQAESDSEYEDYDDLQEIAKEISSKIASYKANLRKFYIQNGYAKKLN